MSLTVHLEASGYLALSLDDGKVNALDEAVLERLLDAFSQAAVKQQAVLLQGREGCFSAGYNLKVMQAGGEPRRRLRALGDQLKLAMLEHPAPVVIACTGHALAKGALLLMCADHRLGMQGAFQLGLNETAIGISMPQSAIELAKARLDTRLHSTMILNAQLLSPEQAQAAGLLDELIPRDGFLHAAKARMQTLLALDKQAYAQTKARLRAPLLARLRQSFAED